MDQTLTGLLFTKDRQHLLLANLDRIRGYEFPVMVLDGSDLESPRLVSALGGLDHVTYLHLPGQSVLERVLEGLRHVHTGHVVALSDDDHFVSECVLRCSTFLREHADYVAAQGSYWVRVRRRPWGRQQIVLEEYSPSLDADDAATRMETHGRRYAHTFYAVHRRDVFLESVQNAQAFENEAALFELAQSFTVVARGKVRRLTPPYCIRQPNTRERMLTRYKGQPSNWIRHDREDFKASLDRFFNVLESRAPFRGLPTINGRSAIRAAVENYLDIELDSRRAVHRRYRYVIWQLNRLFPRADAMNWMNRLSQGKVGDVAGRLANRILLEARLGPRDSRRLEHEAPIGGAVI